LRAYGWQPDSLWGTNPIFLKQDDDYYWYLNDQLGTPQKLVDSTGTVVWSAQYEAFGKATIQIDTVENNLRFPGQYFDAETGWHYNNQRYYDSEHGRYTQTDPIGFHGGDVNWYAYVGNNPVNFGDPTGQNAIAIGLGVGFEIGGPPGALLGGAAGLLAMALLGEGLQHLPSSGYFPDIPVEIHPTPSMGAPISWPQACDLSPMPIHPTAVLLPPFMMAAPGNHVDSGIEALVYETMRKMGKQFNRCDILKMLIASGIVDAHKANSTLKAWGCKHSRYSKDKK